MTVIRFAPGLQPVLKHPGHADQKVHGRRFPGSVPDDVASSILERVKANGGLSVSMLDGHEPTSGFMVAKGGTKGDIVPADEFFDPKTGPARLSSFLKTYRSDLTGGSYLGLWHNTEDNQVYLDVSDNIHDEARATRLGRRRDQISIWDVANFREVNTGGTGQLAKAAPTDIAAGHLDDDGRGDRRIGAVDLGEVLRLGVSEVLKHPGHANQKVHGRKGGGGDLPGRWEKVDDESLKTALADRMVASGEADRKTAEYIATKRVELFDTYGDGATTIIVDKKAGLKADDLRETMEMADRLQVAAPRPGMEIEISNSAFRDHGLDDSGYGGFAYVGRPNVYLRPSTVKTGLRDASLMPSCKDNRRVYGLVHEWGHTVDYRDGTTALMDHEALRSIAGLRPSRTAARRGPSADVFDDLDASVLAARHLSLYGQTDKRESWAEAFTEFQLNPRSATSNPVVSYLAEKYNWGSGGEEVRKATGSIEICADTFTTDGPANRTMTPPTLVDRFGPAAPAVVKFSPGLQPVLKHPGHGDQKVHGRKGASHSDIADAARTGEHLNVGHPVPDALRNDFDYATGRKRPLSPEERAQAEQFLARRGEVWAAQNGFSDTDAGTYGDMSSAEIYGAALVRRARDKVDQDERWSKKSDEQAERSKQAFDDWRSDGKVMVSVPSEHLDSILADRVRNQFDTGDSGGILDTDLRAIAETAAFDIHPQVSPEHRPIYGFIGREGFEHPASVSMYGDVTLVLKDHVRDRTTVTIGDSLNTNATPHPLNKPATARQVSDASANTMFFDGGSTTAQMGTTVFAGGYAYMEAQIHVGGVQRSDIERIVFRRSPWTDDDGIAALREELVGEGIGVEVYDAY